MKNFTLGFIVGFVTAPFAYAAVKFYQNKCKSSKDENIDGQCDTSYYDFEDEDMMPCE